MKVTKYYTIGNTMMSKKLRETDKHIIYNTKVDYSCPVALRDVL